MDKSTLRFQRTAHSQEDAVKLRTDWQKHIKQEEVEECERIVQKFNDLICLNPDLKQYEVRHYHGGYDSKRLTAMEEVCVQEKLAWAKFKVTKLDETSCETKFQMRPMRTGLMRLLFGN